MDWVAEWLPCVTARGGDKNTPQNQVRRLTVEVNGIPGDHGDHVRLEYSGRVEDGGVLDEVSSDGDDVSRSTGGAGGSGLEEQWGSGRQRRPQQGLGLRTATKRAEVRIVTGTDGD